MRVLSLFLLLVGALICNKAFAQSLEERVRELERRVQQLEKQQSERQQPASGTPRTTTPTGANRWRYIANWRSLRHGMTEDDVRSVLGEPQKIDAGPVITVWHYDYPRGGSVRFGSSDHRVEGWHEPDK